MALRISQQQPGLMMVHDGQPTRHGRASPAMTICDLMFEFERRARSSEEKSVPVFFLQKQDARRPRPVQAIPTRRSFMVGARGQSSQPKDESAFLFRRR